MLRTFVQFSILKHGVEICENLKISINAIHNCVTLLKNFPKQKEILKTCLEVNIKCKAPELDGDTCWNSKEAMIANNSAY